MKSTQTNPTITGWDLFRYALTLLFVTGKVFGHFTVSWWIVFTPILFPLAHAIVTIVVLLIIGAVYGVFYLLYLGILRIKNGVRQRTSRSLLNTLIRRHPRG